MLVIPSALGSVGINDLISCKSLLKISIKYSSLLSCIMFSVLFNKSEQRPVLGTKHTQAMETKKTQTDRLCTSQKPQTTRRPTEETGREVENLDLGSLLVKLI